jgi:hypothetical protein
MFSADPSPAEIFDVPGYPIQFRGTFVLHLFHSLSLRISRGMSAALNVVLFRRQTERFLIVSKALFRTISTHYTIAHRIRDMHIEGLQNVMPIRCLGNVHRGNPHSLYFIRDRTLGRSHWPNLTVWSYRSFISPFAIPKNQKSRGLRSRE